MLILSRCLNQKIIIDDNIQITVLSVRGRQVRLGILAPKTVSVHREEVYQQIQEKEHNREEPLEIME